MSEDLTKCPQCGGEADNGIDRCIPPSAYMCSKCCAQEEAERQAALQESEAGAVAYAVYGISGGRSFLANVKLVSQAPDGEPLSDEDGWGERWSGNALLYPAPPSAQAIETAAIMRCAEVLDRRIESHKFMSACSSTQDESDAHKLVAESMDYAKERILSLIPQDGRTQLEEFGMKVAESIRYRVSDGRNVEPDDFRAIVTNLIGEKR